MQTHEKYIQRCIEISKFGIRAAMPNPSVGAVIVYNNLIIGEGFTAAYGGNHAEVLAIQAVADKSLLAKSILYVSLEPCAHFGKTPPCTDWIIQNKIPMVVIGCQDTNEIVAGKGIQKLKAAGIKVLVGVLEKECRAANIRFFTYHEKKRPYIILKWAESADGYIAPVSKNLRAPVWLSNEISRQMVHKMRTEEHAILVGTNTVIEDNPKLTARDWKGINPIRIILDTQNRLPKNSYVLDNQAETYVLDKTNLNSNLSFIDSICRFLYEKNILSIIIEGGKQTLQSFIDANLWDEALVYKSEIQLENGIKAPEIFNKPLQSKKIETDTLFIYKNNPFKKKSLIPIF